MNKVKETWDRIDEISKQKHIHQSAIEALEQEEDDIHTTGERETTRLVIEALGQDDNADLKNIIMALVPGGNALFDLHSAYTDEQWSRWHELQRNVSDMSGMYFDSGASQELFIVKIYHRLMNS